MPDQLESLSKEEILFSGLNGPQSQELNIGMFMTQEELQREKQEFESIKRYPIEDRGIYIAWEGSLKHVAREYTLVA